MAFVPSSTLKSRTYIGLLLSQFLAAFNDQAIHIVAIFYAVDMLVRYAQVAHIDDKAIVSIVTACFISPFFLFSTLAGMLADKYGKRGTLVFWKIAEVGMMGLALAGFLLPHLGRVVDPRATAITSAILVISTVFLMGTHSTFFVPAKYGVMPEILHPSVLSRGNGLLEGTSFVAQIIGTSVGGFLYGKLKSNVDLDGNLILGSEWLIGVLLLGLAVVGAFFSMLIQPIPAAAPDLKLTWKLWQPLRKNVAILLHSRPLALAVLGIAFFAFMTLYLRQTLIYEGETGKELHEARRLAEEDSRRANDFDGMDDGDFQILNGTTTKAQRSEFRIAVLIAMVGLGVGIGSSLAGHLSGDKIELGLVPIGCGFLILFTALLAFSLRSLWLMIPCLILIGVAAGLYIVPLYTLLQHRAPKDSKGNLVATSNFVNVAGGLLAVIVFYLVTLIMETALGLSITPKQARTHPSFLPAYIQELERQIRLPMVLCLTASVMTIGMLVLLCRQLPDFIVRALLWLRSQWRYHLHVHGVQNIPINGPAILAANCDRFEDCMHVVASTDRYIRYFLIEDVADKDPRALERYLARQTGLVTLMPGRSKESDWNMAENEALRTLAAGEIVGVTLDKAPNLVVDRWFERLTAAANAQVLPVKLSFDSSDAISDGHSTGMRRARVIFGAPLSPPFSADAARRAIDRLAP